MPIASVNAFVKSLLDDIGMPAGLPAMAAYLNPPDPNVEASFPSAYILSAAGPEKRLAGPRNTGPGTSSGQKTISHEVRVLVVYEIANDDPDADTLREYEQFGRRQVEFIHSLDALRDLPPITRDGHEVLLLGNVEFPHEAASVLGGLSQLRGPPFRRRPSR